MRPGGCRARCWWRPGRASPGCWNDSSAPPPPCQPSLRPTAMSPAGPEDHRSRFRRPLGVAVIAYKAALGLSEITVGVLLAIPSFDPEATFAQLSAEELREDPSDRLIALISRHLPALVHHRRMVAGGLILFGLPSWSRPPPRGRPGMGRLAARRDRRVVAPFGSAPGRGRPHRRACPAGRGKHDRPGCPGPTRPGMATWSATLGWVQPPFGCAPPLR